MILECQRHDLGHWRHGVDALFAPRTEQRQMRRHVQPPHIPARYRSRRHDVPAIDQHRIAGIARDPSILDDVFVQRHPNPAVVGLAMHAPRLGLASFDAARWLRTRHLQDQQLIRAQDVSAP
jgi:hypothetical protein